MIKILYAAYRHDPHNPMSGSGADYQFYTAIKRQSEFSVQIVGPTITHTSLVERVVSKLYKAYTAKEYLRFPLSKTWRASRALESAALHWKPDVIFTLSPAPLLYYSAKVPCIYRIDSTTFGSEQSGQRGIGPMALRVATLQERRALAKCKLVITHSDWCKEDLVRNHGVDISRIRMFPNPAALPDDVVPTHINIAREKSLISPLRLLLVGRPFWRKGVDIAIESVQILNARGIPCHLTICGLSEIDAPNVESVGLYDKADPTALCQYVSHFRQAHLLLHPARFDPSPIVTSEAAAFAVPTITNSAGGIATSVKNDVSGIVLPERSDAPAYAQIIEKLVRTPDRYYELCRTTRDRFERELNWNIASQQLGNLVREVVESEELNFVGN